MSDKFTELLLEKYCDNPDQLELLLTHSRMVARKAVEIALGCGIEGLDMEFIHEAAMLHDIGVVMVDAPSIHCHGPLPYICHGIAGAGILEAEDLPRHALVAERHTGSGLTAAEIEAQGLPLPHRDLLPVSHEEKIICLADKFYSKSATPEQEKSMERIRKSMAKFGDAALARFDALVAGYLDK